MKSAVVAMAVLTGAAAMVWLAGPNAPALGQAAAGAAPGETVEPVDEPAERATPLSDAIRRFVWDMRRDARERWFHAWNETDWSETELPDRRPRADGPWEDDAWLDDDAWWDEALAAPEHRALVERETPRRAVAAAASGRGTAVSIAVVDGHYEIEAAWSGQDGPQRFRARGARAEIERWAADLPGPLRRAVLDHLEFAHGDGVAR
jgi:hypothetical protein